MDRDGSRVNADHASRRKTTGCRRISRDSGWSLIELLVVVVALTILTLAAVPTYRTAMLRAHRTEATAALLAVAAAQERFHLQHQAYASDIEAAPPDGLGLPSATESGRYVIAVTSADAAAFTATATAQAGQSQDTHCAQFGLDSAGLRTATSWDCWGR
jgi:type IV pilus assembly protein PilE